jgi:hypothetical protein
MDFNMPMFSITLEKVNISVFIEGNLKNGPLTSIKFKIAPTIKTADRQPTYLTLPPTNASVQATAIVESFYPEFHNFHYQSRILFNPLAGLIKPESFYETFLEDNSYQTDYAKLNALLDNENPPYYEGQVLSGLVQNSSPLEIFTQILDFFSKRYNLISEDEKNTLLSLIFDYSQENIDVVSELVPIDSVKSLFEENFEYVLAACIPKSEKNKASLEQYTNAISQAYEDYKQNFDHQKLYSYTLKTLLKASVEGQAIWAKFSYTSLLKGITWLTPGVPTEEVMEITLPANATLHDDEFVFLERLGKLRGNLPSNTTLTQVCEQMYYDSELYLEDKKSDRVYLDFQEKCQESLLRAVCEDISLARELQELNGIITRIPSPSGSTYSTPYLLSVTETISFLQDLYILNNELCAEIGEAFKAYVASPKTQVEADLFVIKCNNIIIGAVCRDLVLASKARECINLLNRFTTPSLQLKNIMGLQKAGVTLCDQELEFLELLGSLRDKLSLDENFTQTCDYIYSAFQSYISNKKSPEAYFTFIDEWHKILLNAAFKDVNMVKEFTELSKILAKISLPSQSDYYLHTSKAGIKALNFLQALSEFKSPPIIEIHKAFKLWIFSSKPLDDYHKFVTSCNNALIIAVLRDSTLVPEAIKIAKLVISVSPLPRQDLLIIKVMNFLEVFAEFSWKEPGLLSLKDILIDYCENPTEKAYAGFYNRCLHDFISVSADNIVLLKELNNKFSPLIRDLRPQSWINTHQESYFPKTRMQSWIEKIQEETGVQLDNIEEAEVESDKKTIDTQEEKTHSSSDSAHSPTQASSTSSTYLDEEQPLLSKECLAFLERLNQLPKPKFCVPEHFKESVKAIRAAFIRYLRTRNSENFALFRTNCRDILESISRVECNRGTSWHKTVNELITPVINQLNGVSLTRNDASQFIMRRPITEEKELKLERALKFLTRILNKEIADLTSNLKQKQSTMEAKAKIDEITLKRKEIDTFWTDYLCGKKSTRNLVLNVQALIPIDKNIFTYTTTTSLNEGYSLIEQALTPFQCAESKSTLSTLFELSSNSLWLLSFFQPIAPNPSGAPKCQAATSKSGR